MILSRIQQIKSSGLSIAVDARSLCGPLSGIGHYVHEVLKALDKVGNVQLHVYCAPRFPTVPLPDHWHVRMVPLPRQIAIKAVFGHWARMDKVDVFWAPQTILPRGKFPKVATVHDLNHILVPETMSWGTALAHRLWFESDIHRADRVVANSSGTSERLMSLLGRRADQVAVPGVVSRFRPMNAGEYTDVLSKYQLQPGYVLAVGTLEPRKNLQALIRAHASLYADGRVPELVLGGSIGWGKALPPESFPGVRLLGYVADEHLPALFSAARAYAIPSLYEGYGMPAAEARACGVNILASDIPELREAAGPGAVFVATDESSIREGLLKVVSEPPSELVNERVCWEQTAEIYLEQFTSVIQIV